jgi:hypothetical protein
MMIQNTNFKTVSGKTQNYDLFNKILLKSIISRDSISLSNQKISKKGSCGGTKLRKSTRNGKVPVSLLGGGGG